MTIPGVGKKTAGRIVLELKDKLQKEVLPEEELSEIGSVTMNTDARSEAISALLALGYSVAEAQKAVPVSKEGAGLFCRRFDPDGLEADREIISAIIKGIINWENKRGKANE